MGLQNMHNNRQDGYNLLRIVGSGVSLLEQSFGGKRRRVMASNGDEWRQLWLRMASNGVDGWRQESTDKASPSGVRKRSAVTIFNAVDRMFRDISQMCSGGVLPLLLVVYSRVFLSCVTWNLHKYSTELL